MSLKRQSNEPTTSEIKNQKLNQETEDDFFQWCPLDDKFNGKWSASTDNVQRGMIGSINFPLALSFCDNRENDGDFLKNGAALQLYSKDYKPYEQTYYKSFDIPIMKPVFYYNRWNEEECTYGHVERRLMRMVLDDLIKVDPQSIERIVAPIGFPGEGKYVIRPSNIIIENENMREYEILKHLTENASEYRQYLESKDVIVKMWSERTACDDEKRIGGACKTFMENICPKGSKFGYIVKETIVPYASTVSAEFARFKELLKDAFTAHKKEIKELNLRKIAAFPVKID